jgi:hypothetical protein
MRRRAALVGLGLVLAAAAPARDDTAGTAIVAALGAGASDISTSAERLDGSPFTWASWTEVTPDRWVTRLVLVRRTAAGVAITWGVQRPNAYGAVLRPTLWRCRTARPSCWAKSTGR